MKSLKEIIVGKRLSEEEMKQIKGAVQIVCARSYDGRTWTFFQTDSPAVADAWCYVWDGFDYDCVCKEINYLDLYYCAY